MEDLSWQIKCSSTSTLQSLASSSMASSSSSSHELLNQTERKAGYYSYPHDPHDLRRKVLGAVRGPPVPNHPNLSSSQKPTHVSLGNSFLALLSGPPTLLQCDFKELSNSRLPSDSNSVGVNAVGSEYLSEQSLQLGPDFCSSILTRTGAGSNGSTNSAFPGLHTPELETTVNHQLVTGNVKPTCSFSVSGEWGATILSSSSKVSSTKVQTAEMKSVDQNSPISDHSSSFLSNCPRVFCLGTVGYLLISNTGLLGIVCSCHNLRMSVLKFCEHSGLCGGNAGDFVRMESGESIAMWRKLYFLKFGIRISEDQSDWDWPEGLTATSGLGVKSRTSFPNNSYNISHLAHSSEGKLRPGQVSDSVMLSNLNTYLNSVTDASHNKQKRNAQEGKNVSIEGFIGTSQRNMHILANPRILEHPLSGFSTVSKSLSSGPQDNYRSAIYTDNILKNGDSHIVCPTVQDLRTIVQKPDFSMSKTAPNAVFIGSGDAAFSNIELKLGQPHQSSQNSKMSDQPALGARLLDTFVNPSKLLFTQQPIHNTAGCRSKVEVGQSLFCAADPCSSNNKSEQSQLNLGNSAFGFSSVNIAATPTLDKSGANLDHNTVASLHNNFNLLTGNSVQINPNNNMLSSTKRTVPHPQRCEPYFTACDSSHGPWNYGIGIERQLMITEMGPHGLTDQSKGDKVATNGPYFMKDSGSRTHKGTETSASHPFSSATHPFSTAPLETSDAKRLPSNPVNIPSFESNLQVDHVTCRSLTSNFGSRQILPSQVIMKGLPLASSTCLPDQTPALHREEGIGHRPHLLDDNSRMLALRQLMELSKQQSTFTSIGMNRWEGRCDGISHFHHSVAESLTPGDQCNGHGVAGNREANEAAIRAYLAGATNTTSCCDLSTLIRGIPMHSKEIEVHGQLSGDPLQDEQLPMSRIHEDISGPRPTEHEKCCRVPSACIQNSCNCSVYRNCSERNLESKGESFPYALKEQRGKVNGESSTKFSSKFHQNHIGPNSEIPSTEQEAISNCKLSKNIIGHSSQWRDVPSKVKGTSKDICGDTSAKCIDGPVQTTHPCKDHANSNISSGSCAPAVTQLSVEISNMDSSGTDARNSGCVSNLDVDEGSAIDKCWSSDDAHGSERSSEFHQDMCKTSSKDSGSSLNANHQSSRSLLDELKLINSLTWKKGQKQIQMEVPAPKDDLSICLKKERQKKVCSSVVHCEKYGETNSADFKSSASKSIQMISLPKPNGSEHRLSVSLPMKKPIRTRELCKLYNDKEDKHDCQTELKASGSNCKIPEAAAGKKFKRDRADAFRRSLIGGETHAGTRTMKKRNLEGCLKSSFSSLTNSYSCRPRPVVCGKYGELCTGEFSGDMEKSSKIVPLSRVLRSAKRCELATNGKPTQSSLRKFKQAGIDGIKESYDESQHLKTEEGNRSHGAEVCGKATSETSLGMKNGFSGRDYELAGNSPISEIDRHHRNKKEFQEEDNIPNTRSKSKTKEIRKRSIYELTVDDNNVCLTSRKGPRHKKSSLSETSKCFPERTESKLLRNDNDIKHELCKGDEKSAQEKTFSSRLDLDSFCCVCGGSNKDELNYLLQCNKCLVMVHQACYGVSRVPKGHWYCRPCRTSSRNIVCVLCGYGGGAMTQALRSRTIVKSLLRVWNFETEGNAKNVILPVKTLKKSPSRWDCTDSGCEGGSSLPVLQLENAESLASTIGKTDLPYHLHVSQNCPDVTKIKVDNSITAGLLNSTTKQWIHMVCGLWTPGTRCPNVDTMSAFDVSGALRPKSDAVCSICSRRGGTCIKCRILNCSVHFHPWCAHQKGLLQSEVEGVENESVGFYGRCLLHSTNPMCESDCGITNPVTSGGSGTDEPTCARTEGYKGRKRDGFFHSYFYNQSKGKVGCYVPQEQLNAWTYICAQKSGFQGLPTLPAVSDVEHDCRKEYSRYKQGRGWKRLVVYKSGIHALGLYTSRFISRGEMVVEYVGEIVGARVSDKRENEYQSGRKLQYKSACYFFRIDKEHIIDATRKGGIARFVNHSCLPNCVAKVISIRNDKKVVFFAERDIFPGEEITYDYHFNHEDEGKKIPCFCNSKNCRRYLN